MNAQQERHSSFQKQRKRIKYYQRQERKSVNCFLVVEDLIASGSKDEYLCIYFVAANIVVDLDRKRFNEKMHQHAFNMLHVHINMGKNLCSGVRYLGYIHSEYTVYPMLQFFFFFFSIPQNPCF